MLSIFFISYTFLTQKEKNEKKKEKEKEKHIL